MKMKIPAICVLSTLSAIAEGNLLAAAARGLYAPVGLSIGAMIAFVDRKVQNEGDFGGGLQEWWNDKFSKHQFLLEEKKEKPDWKKTAEDLEEDLDNYEE